MLVHYFDTTESSRQELVVSYYNNSKCHHYIGNDKSCSGPGSRKFCIRLCIVGKAVGLVLTTNDPRRENAF